jgi:diaminohydroxyphosphoribosylaminopyrimidine deaminase/5-amino-6-(5-phosphoribosylamino)uracil reductase
MTKDLIFMSQAIQLARKGWYTTQPNPRVGCVLVKNNQIIGRGFHKQAGQPHAEINAISSVSESSIVKGSTAYVSLEPCSHFGKTPPCCDALIKAGIKRVVVAMTDPNPLVSGLGIQRLKDAGIEVIVGILEKEAVELNRGFIKRMIENKPFVRCKMAASLDGQTALSSGESQWITSTQARQDVQRLRAESSAIMTGIGTVLADNPSMTVRDPHFNLHQQPARVILDSHLSIPIDAKILSEPGQVHIFTSGKNSLNMANYLEKVKYITQTGAKIHIVDYIDGVGLDLEKILTELAKLNINEVLLESGKALAGAMLSSGLVDELIVYLAPKLMGSGGRGMFDLTGIDSMQDTLPLQLKDTRQVGDDMRFTYKLIKH